MAKIVNSWNEWDPLKRIIVGRPEGTQVPGPEPGDYSDQPSLGFPLGKYGPFPQELVDAANEQMDNFVSILEGRGIVVDRVEVHPAYMDVRAVSTPDWTQTNVRGINNPRDVFMTVGNEIIEAPGALRSRWYEYLNLRPIFERYFKEDPEFLWTSAPKPRLTNDSYEKNYFYNYHKVWSDEIKRERMEKCQFQLTEKEPMWDAACAMRYGRDVTWFHSCVTNFAAIDWLKRYFGARGVRIHPVRFGTTTDVFRSYHIDVLLVPVRPGLVMHNPTRPILTEEMIELYKRNDWEIVEAVEPTHYYPLELDLWAYGEHEGPSWISMNTLSLGPNTICVEAHEERYIEQLTKLGIEVVAVPYDKVVQFGGSLHCTTLDVYREGTLEDYFPNQVPGY